MCVCVFLSHMPPLSGMDEVIFYLKKLNSLHRRAAKPHALLLFAFLLSYNVSVLLFLSLIF